MERFFSFRAAPELGHRDRQEALLMRPAADRPALAPDAPGILSRLTGLKRFAYRRVNHYFYRPADDPRVAAIPEARSARWYPIRDQSLSGVARGVLPLRDHLSDCGMTPLDTSLLDASLQSRLVLSSLPALNKVQRDVCRESGTGAKPVARDVMTALYQGLLPGAVAITAQTPIDDEQQNLSVYFIDSHGRMAARVYQMFNYDERVLEIGLVEVEPEHRNKGFAARLLHSTRELLSCLCPESPALIDLRAESGVMIGSYVWGRFGFECAPDELEHVVNRGVHFIATQSGLSPEDQQASMVCLQSCRSIAEVANLGGWMVNMANLEDATRDNHPSAMMPLGKALLLSVDRGWNGSMDPASYHSESHYRLISYSAKQLQQYEQRKNEATAEVIAFLKDELHRVASDDAWANVQTILDKIVDFNLSHLGTLLEDVMPHRDLPDHTSQQLREVLLWINNAPAEALICRSARTDIDWVSRCEALTSAWTLQQSRFPDTDYLAFMFSAASCSQDELKYFILLTAMTKLSDPYLHGVAYPMKSFIDGVFDMEAQLQEHNFSHWQAFCAFVEADMRLNSRP